MKTLIYGLLLMQSTALLAQPLCSAQQQSQAKPLFQQALKISQQNMQQATALLQQAAQYCPSATVLLTLTQGYIQQQHWQLAKQTLDKIEQSNQQLTPSQTQQYQGLLAAYYLGLHQQAIEQDSQYPKQSLCKANRFGQRGCGFLAQALLSINQAQQIEVSQPDWLNSLKQQIETARVDYSWQQADINQLVSLNKSAGYGKTALDLPIHFDFNRYHLNTNAINETEALIGFVKSETKQQRYLIQLRGHTDQIGSEQYNQNLSRLRAQEVKQALAQQFPEQTIVIVGMGKSDLLCQNSDEHCRARNRRVELRLIPQH